MKYFTTFCLFLSIALLPNLAHAGLSENVKGFMWSNTIGWISLNSINCDPDGNLIYNGAGDCPTGAVATSTLDTDGYGVSFDELTGNLVGYGWSPNVGWVKFGGLGSFPTVAGFPPSGTVGSNARVNDTGTTGVYTDDYIEGWIKVCAVYVSGCSGQFLDAQYTGGWDGWVSLTGNTTDGGDYKALIGGNGKLWGSNIVGWVGSNRIEIDRAVVACTLGGVPQATLPSGYKAVGGICVETQCNDGIDNEPVGPTRDGLIDFGAGAGSDPGCTEIDDDDETDTVDLCPAMGGIQNPAPPFSETCSTLLPLICPLVPPQERTQSCTDNCTGAVTPKTFACIPDTNPTVSLKIGLSTAANPNFDSITIAKDKSVAVRWEVGNFKAAADPTPTSCSLTSIPSGGITGKPSNAAVTTVSGTSGAIGGFATAGTYKFILSCKNGVAGTDVKDTVQAVIIDTKPI